MKEKRNALGRGLGALLQAEVNTLAQPNSTAPFVPVDKIEANPYQPRTHFEKTALEELASSIRIHGVIQPLTVRRLGPDAFQLISGERRLRASKLAGLTEVPAYILETDNRGMLEMAIIENIQREDLNAIEVAISYQRLIDEVNLKQEELAERVGKERSTVTNYLRLLKLPPEIQVGVRDSKISMGHARALVGVEEVETQLAIYRKVLSDDLSVRKTEVLVREMTQSKPGSKKPKQSASKHELPIQYRDLQRSLQSRFDTKVNLTVDDKGKGEITIPFFDQDDLNRILDLFGHEE